MDLDPQSSSTAANYLRSYHYLYLETNLLLSLESWVSLSKVLLTYLLQRLLIFFIVMVCCSKFVHPLYSLEMAYVLGCYDTCVYR